MPGVTAVGPFGQHLDRGAPQLLDRLEDGGELRAELEPYGVTIEAYDAEVFRDAEAEFVSRLVGSGGHPV